MNEDEVDDVDTRETTATPPKKMKAPVLLPPKKGKGRAEQESPTKKRGKKRDMGPKREPSVELGRDLENGLMSDG